MKDNLRDSFSDNIEEIEHGEGKTGNPEARDQCRLGNLYTESALYEYAVDAYKRAISLDTSYATAHHNLGAVYYKLGLFDEAQEELESAIKIRPDDPLFHYTLGLVLKDDKKFNECIESFSKAISLSPDYIEAYYRRGSAYFYIGELEKATIDLEEVVKREPKFRDALYNLGVIYISLKKWELARETFLRQLEIEPHDVDAIYYLAIINIENDKDLEQAISNLNKALEIDPEHLRSLFQLALIYARQRYENISHRKESIDHLIKLIDIYEDTGDFDHIHDAFFLLGSLYDDDPDDIDLAIAAYEKGLELADWSAEAHNNLGVLYSKKGLVDKAVIHLRHAIALDPDYGNPYHNLAKIYFYQRNEEIIKDFQFWIENITEDSAKIIFNLTLALIDVGRAEACESIYSKAHKIKNLIGVAGSKLRRVIKDSDIEKNGKLRQVLEEQEKCYNEMVNLLGTLKHEGLVLDMVDINSTIKSVITQVGFKPYENLELSLCNEFCLGNIKCCTNLDQSLPKIKGDYRKLKEAFSNIIINSIEAIKDSGIINILTSYSESSSGVEITFIDTGIGIPIKDIDNIFKPGYTTKRTGSGFGLSIVNRIIAEHKGNIRISSKEGEGTEVKIIIPVNLELAPIHTSLRMRPVVYEDPGELISTEVDSIVNS